MAKKEDVPLEEGDAIAWQAQLTNAEKIEIAPASIIACLDKHVLKIFRKRSTAGITSWRGLERYLKPFIMTVRRARKEIEHEYGVRLPAHCLLIR